MTPIPRLRDHKGPALFSYGFRPFFLFGSLYAGLAILTWLPLYFGELELSTAFHPRDWHIHEMLYGYLSAVITGFLLTAIPNWTGRMPIQGWPLAILVCIWVAGRVAMSSSAWIGWLPAAVIDASFLLAIVGVAAREIIAGRKWHNLPVLLLLGSLFAGNVIFHLEARGEGMADYGVRLGIAAGIVLIMLMGGRMVPSFTRNWLVRENPGRLPAPYARFDSISLGVAVVAIIFWIAAPQGLPTAFMLFVAGVLQATRLARWAGDRTWRDRLVLVLHIAYAFVPLGFGLLGLAALDLVPQSAGVHAWTGGAIGLMTLAVMSRASLGHTGRALIATALTQALYGLVIISTLARICAALEPQWSTPLLHVAAFAWVGAFVGFGASYWRVFTQPRMKS